MVASSRQADKPYSATRKWAEGNLDLYFLVVSMSVLHRRLRLEVKMSLYLVGYILFEKDEFFQSNIGKSPSPAHCSMHSLMSALHVSSSDDENSRKFRWKRGLSQTNERVLPFYIGHFIGTQRKRRRERLGRWEKKREELDQEKEKEQKKKKKKCIYFHQRMKRCNMDSKKKGELEKPHNETTWYIFTVLLYNLILEILTRRSFLKLGEDNSKWKRKHSPLIGNIR